MFNICLFLSKFRQFSQQHSIRKIHNISVYVEVTVFKAIGLKYIFQKKDLFRIFNNFREFKHIYTYIFLDRIKFVSASYKYICTYVCAQTNTHNRMFDICHARTHTYINTYIYNLINFIFLMHIKQLDTNSHIQQQNRIVVFVRFYCFYCFYFIFYYLVFHYGITYDKHTHYCLNEVIFL